MLSLLLIIPIIGALSIVPIEENMAKPQSISNMKKVALGASLLNFVVSIVL